MHTQGNSLFNYEFASSLWTSTKPSFKAEAHLHSIFEVERRQREKDKQATNSAKKATPQESATESTPVEVTDIYFPAKVTLQQTSNGLEKITA